MPTLTVTKNYTDGSTLTESHLDTAFESVESFMNTTKLDADNLQSSAVTEAKIGAAAVTEAKIGSGAVTTSKLGTGAVTQVKMETRTVGTSASAGHMAVTATSNSVSSTSTSLTDVNNMSAAITTLGNPVSISFVSDGSGGESYIYALEGSAGNSTQGTFVILRDSTEISRINLAFTGTGTSNPLLRLPPGVLNHIDRPSAGSYTYKLQFKTTSGDTVGGEAIKMVVYEIK